MNNPAGSSGAICNSFSFFFYIPTKFQLIPELLVPAGKDLAMYTSFVDGMNSEYVANGKMRFVPCDNIMHISEFDYIVEGDGYPLNTRELDNSEEQQAAYRAIGGYLSELVESGATLEVGIGRLNSSAMMYLEGVSDLGVHTEIYGDLLMELTEKGIVNNRKKVLNPGISVCTQIVGSEKLMEYAANNEEIHMDCCNHVLNPGIIAIGLAGRKYGGTMNDFMTAGKQGTLLLVTGSYIGSHIGNGIVVGGAEYGAEYGIGGMWYGIGAALSFILFSFVMSRVVFRGNCTKSLARRLAPVTMFPPQY